MEIIAATETDVDRVLYLNVSWQAYEVLAESLGDDAHVHLAYDGETLEIMSPGTQHERYANRISEFISAVVYEWHVKFDNTGQTTFKAKPKGFEADKTYYIANAAKISGVKNIDLSIHPPPDLVIEVDITTTENAGMHKFKLYAQIGIPEFWRYKPEPGLKGFALVDKQYVEIDTSRVIKGLPLHSIARRLEQEDDLLTILDEWHQWLKENRTLHRPE